MSKSKFTGSVLGLIGVSLVASLITICTLGLCAPAAICYVQRWYAKHTYIDGNPLVFVGTGWDLFCKGLIWFLLTIITLGIYSFWIPIKYQQWIVENTHQVQL